MMTIKEMSRRTGVSIRTLQYYDRIGLLRPAAHTQSSYRLYDDTDLERMQQILLFRELRFPLKQIREILDSPNFDRNKALRQQIGLLTIQKERLEDLISLAGTILTKGERTMDFEPFSKEKERAYTEEARKQWGKTAAWQEYAEKASGRTDEDTARITGDFMKLFEEFGAMRDADPTSAGAQEQVKKLQSFITEHYYTCTTKILRCLGQMYAAGGEMTQNIDRAGGSGTAAFAAAAIEVYCK